MSPLLRRAVCGVGLPLVGAVLLTVLLTGCASEGPIRTPLPARMNVVAPRPDTPELVAAFSGIWAGRWASHVGVVGSGSMPVDHTLVVERIAPAPDDQHRAAVIYSLGVGPGHPPLFYRTSGIISPDGVLRLDPTPKGEVVTYRLAATRQTLTCEFRGNVGQSFAATGVLWRTTEP